ncbi:MAG: pyrroline-5-carboxylate reductase [Caulobacter sp.]|nr:pyrroline-5-carboxylate reductase [Caulobacter sp.]
MIPATILLLGAGRMGGAMIEGWSGAGPVTFGNLLIRDPHPGAEALAAVKAGATINPPDSALKRATIVIVAVKPQLWRAVAVAAAPHLSPDAVILSIAAGVSIESLAEVFGERDIARVMPTTAVAIGQGTASIAANSDYARQAAHELFDSIANTVDIADEALMHAATAVSGSGPAYLYAFVEALEAAAVQAGLPAADAATLAHSTIAGAAALMTLSEATPAQLREQVTSPGGTTQAALEVLMGPGGLRDLLTEAVAAAVQRSKELG